MNKNVFTSSYVFISSLGLHSFYIIVFLIGNRCLEMSVLSTDHSDYNNHSLFIRTRIFSCSSKKSLTELLHNIYITLLLCGRFRFFTTNESYYISVWTKILNNSSVCCVCLYDWFVWGWQYYTRRMIVTVVYVEFKFGKQLMFFVCDSKLVSHLKDWEFK